MPPTAVPTWSPTVDCIDSPDCDQITDPSLCVGNAFFNTEIRSQCPSFCNTPACTTTMAPSARPTPGPTMAPTPEPTLAPTTPGPTLEPIPAPTAAPGTSLPTLAPSTSPTESSCSPDEFSVDGACHKYRICRKGVYADPAITNTEDDGSGAATEPEPCHCTIRAADNDLENGTMPNPDDCFQCKVIKMFNPRSGWFVGPASDASTAGFGVTCLRCKNSRYLEVLGEVPVLRTRCAARPVPSDAQALVAHRSFKPGSFADDDNDYGRELREPFVCHRPDGASKFAYVSEPASTLLAPVRAILALPNGSNLTPSGRAYQDCSCIRNAKIQACEWKTANFAADHPEIVSKELDPGSHTVVRALNCGQKKYLSDPTTVFYHRTEKIFYEGKCVGPVNCPSTQSKVGFSGSGRICADPGFCTIGADGVGTTTLTTTSNAGVTYDTEVPCMCAAGAHTCYWAANNAHAENKRDTRGVTTLLCNTGLSLETQTGACLPDCIPPYVSRPMSVGGWCVLPGAARGSINIVVNGTVLQSGPLDAPLDVNAGLDSNSRSLGHVIWWLIPAVVLSVLVAVVVVLRHRSVSHRHAGNVVCELSATTVINPATLHPLPLLAEQQF